MDLISFLGRFHPLFVHLPIGILILACLFDWLSFTEKFKSLKEAVRLTLLLGAFSALASCVTGYLLSLSGEYDSTTVGLHQWLGIVTMLISFTYWQLKRKEGSEKLSKAFSVTTLVLISFTGHFGGSLTHGENYLTESLTVENTPVDFSSLDVTKAVYYRDVVQPVLNARCYSCHGETKQKGKLRLDQPDHILKGGKNGNTVVAAHPDESELINRLLLPLDDKKHMPPKEKPQLSPVEIGLLKNWISLGADFSKSIHELHAVESVSKILSSASTAEKEIFEPVKAADEKVIAQLRKYNVTVVPLAEGDNHLSMNLINTQYLDSAVVLLPSVKEQLVWLTASSSKLEDKHLEQIAKVSSLRKLDISHSSVSDEGILYLKNLKELKTLNLSFTQITSAGLKTLLPDLKLKNVFLFNTLVTPAETESLKKEFPAVKVETGNYQVSTLAEDTTLVKPPLRP